MKTVKQITALILALLMLYTAAQAEKWLPAEKNALRFQKLVDLLGDAVREGGSS